MYFVGFQFFFFVLFYLSFFPSIVLTRLVVRYIICYDRSAKISSNFFNSWPIQGKPATCFNWNVSDFFSMPSRFVWARTLQIWLLYPIYGFNLPILRCLIHIGYIFFFFFFREFFVIRIIHVICICIYSKLLFIMMSWEKCIYIVCIIFIYIRMCFSQLSC